MIKDPELPDNTLPLESSLELIGQPWLGRWQGILPATPTHLLASPLERSGRETPDSLPLEWDPTGDVGGSSSHEDDDEGDEEEEERTYFSALSGRFTARIPRFYGFKFRKCHKVIKLGVHNDSNGPPPLGLAPQEPGQRV